MILPKHRTLMQLGDAQREIERLRRENAEAHKREVRLCDRLGDANMKLLLSEQARQALEAKLAAAEAALIKCSEKSRAVASIRRLALQAAMAAKSEVKL